MQQKRTAFTLVELLLLIAVVGLLLAVLVPMLNTHKCGHPRSVQCVSNLKQIGQAGIAYATRNPQSLLPPARTRNPADPSRIHTWVPNMLGLLGRNDLAAEIANDPTGTNWSCYYSLLRCPSNPATNPKDAAFSYLLNGGRANMNNQDWPANGACDDAMDLDGDGEINTASLGYIAKADGISNTIMATESLDAGLWDMTNASEIQSSVLWDDSRGKIINTSPPTPGRPSSKHHGGVNMVFCDASARFVSENIDNMVYARLMSSHGRACKYPATNIAGPAWQGIPLKESDLNK